MPSAFLQWLYADAADVPQTGYEVSRNSDPMSPKFMRPRTSASGSLVIRSDKENQKMHMISSGIPSFWSSNGAEHLGEDGLLLQQGEEARHERQEPVLRHRGNELVEHGPLAEQRVGAPFSGAGAQHTVVAKVLACGTEQGQQGDAKGGDQPEAVTAGPGGGRGGGPGPSRNP